MRLSSINLQKADTAFAFLHNTRILEPAYLIDDSALNEYSCSAEEAFEKYTNYLEKALESYTKRTKQKIQVKEEKYVWEAVVNIADKHTLASLHKLVRVLEKRFGWRELQTVLHRDEGYVDERTGKHIYNYHAHIMFFMLSKAGIYMFKKRDFSKRVMSEIQTITANVLGMKRGKPSRKVRLNASQYRQVAKEKEDLEFQIVRLEDDFESVLEAGLKEHERNQILEEKVRKLLKRNQDLEAMSKKSKSDDIIASLLPTIPEEGDINDTIIHGNREN